jgi:hypothetical protein
MECLLYYLKIQSMISPLRPSRFESVDPELWRLRIDQITGYRIEKSHNYLASTIRISRKGNSRYNTPSFKLTNRGKILASYQLIVSLVSLRLYTTISRLGVIDLCSLVLRLHICLDFSRSSTSGDVSAVEIGNQAQSDDPNGKAEIIEISATVLGRL